MTWKNILKTGPSDFIAANKWLNDFMKTATVQEMRSFLVQLYEGSDQLVEAKKFRNMDDAGITAEMNRISLKAGTV